MKGCLVCEKGTLKNVEDIILEMEGYVFIVKGERCTFCGEEFPYKEEMQRAIEAARN